jgi:hypothetical protein
MHATIDTAAAGIHVRGQFSAFAAVGVTTVELPSQTVPVRPIVVAVVPIVETLVDGWQC